VLKSWANPDGTQRIENTGALTMKRMETVDEEFLAGALDFIDRQHKAGKPFFTWFNSTRMHIWTRLKPESRNKTGIGVYADGMVEHDGHVGQQLAKLDELGITRETIVIYTTDNGAEVMSWPDGGCTPFRGEKATTWEGGFRAPCCSRWPGRIQGGQVINDIVSLQDWLPTLMAAVGEPEIKQKLLAGHRAGARTYKVHVDGYNQLPLLTGQGLGARQEMFYLTDDGDLAALRYGNWKLHFMIQEAHGLHVWERAFTPLRFPKLFNLRKRSLRARGRGDGLQPLARRACLRARARAGLCRSLPRDVPRLPAAPEGRESQPRPGDGHAAARRPLGRLLA